MPIKHGHLAFFFFNLAFGALAINFGADFISAHFVFLSAILVPLLALAILWSIIGCSVVCIYQCLIIIFLAAISMSTPAPST